MGVRNPNFLVDEHSRSREIIGGIAEIARASGGIAMVIITEIPGAVRHLLHGGTEFPEAGLEPNPSLFIANNTK